jgi:hypothetical protein
VNPGAEERCWTSDDADCDGDLGLGDEDCSPDGADSASDRDGVITGTSSSDRIGSQLASGEDVNADGYEDLLVTAEAPGSGAAWLFLGGPSGLGASSLSPTSADQTWAGGTGSSSLGSGAALGDISGDGLADVIVGDSRHSTTSSEGAVFARFGALTVASSAGPASADLAVVHSEAGAYLGAVATGDLDGDGVHELVLGAPGADQVKGVATNVGAVYLFVGGTGLSGSLTEADADRALYGEHQGDGAGEVVAVVPDTDGDGLDDLFIGAPGWDPDPGTTEDSGAVWIVPGDELDTLSAGGPENLLDDVGVRIWYPAADLGLGQRIASADLDQDGELEVVLGSYEESPPGPGRIYLVDPGGLRGLSPGDAMDVVSPSGGVRAVAVEGSEQYDFFGFSVAALDGLQPRVAVGTPGWDGTGDESILRGGLWLFDSDNDLLDASAETVDSLDATFVASDSSTDPVGTGLASAGDIDDDGQDELWVSALGLFEPGRASLLLRTGAR